MKYLSTSPYAILVVFLLGTSLPLRAESAVFINEISVCNISNEMDDGFNFSGWIEFFNASDNDIDLYSCWFSDDPMLPMKYKLTTNRILPAHGYSTIWLNDEILDGKGLFLDADADGGFLSIADEFGVKLDSLYFPKQFTNVSYGRVNDGENQYGYLLRSSQKASNNGIPTAFIMVEQPIIEPSSGFYSDSVSITMHTSTPESLIFYTLDGSNPNSSSLLYNGVPIVLKNTTPLRAQAFSNGCMDSRISSSTFMINEREPDLPVFFINMDTTYLYDDSIGIYCVGVNGIGGGGISVPANYNQDWTRPANIVYLDKNKNTGLNQMVGIELNGKGSRHFPQKSLKIKASKRYGTSRLDYSFFADKPNLKLKSVLLRNGGQNFTKGALRDLFLQNTASVLNLERQAGTQTAVYINGIYWGYMNVRERHNMDFLKSNLGYMQEETDVIDYNYKEYVGNGNPLAFDELKQFIRNNDASLDSIYNGILSRIDVDSYLNYMAIELFVCNEDWPKNNQVIFRNRNNGRWRWLLQDLENGYKQSTLNLLEEFEESTSDLFGLKLITYLLKNERFKERYIDNQCLVAGSIFNLKRAFPILDSLMAGIDSEYLFHAPRWGIAGTFRNELHHNTEMNKEMTLELQKTAYQNLRTNFNLDTTFQLSISAIGAAPNLMFNTLEIPALPYNGMYFKEKELKLTAPLYAGNKTFKCWAIRTDTLETLYASELETTVRLTGNTAVEAVYELKETGRRMGLYINELSASNPIFADNYFKTEDWVELFNNSEDSISLKDYCISTNSSNLSMFSFGSSVQELSLPANGYLVVWCSKEPSRGPNHVNFKLPKEGGQVFLSRKDTLGNLELLDSLTYGSFSEFCTFGRYPDGASDLYVLQSPSIGRKNLQSSYNDFRYTQSSLMVGLQEIKKKTKSNYSIYTDEAGSSLHILNPSAEKSNISLFDLSGRLLLRKTLTDVHSVLDICDLSDGIYLLRILGRNGGVTIKFKK